MTGHITPSTDQDKAYVTSQLMAFNGQHFAMSKEEYVVPLNFHIEGEEGGIVAGVMACMYARSSVYINILWVDAAHRQHKYGSQLLQYVEGEAKKQGAVMVHLDTFDFQAKGFYLKQGYALVSVLEDSPAVGHKRFYLRKML